MELELKTFSISLFIYSKLTAVIGIFKRENGFCGNFRALRGHLLTISPIALIKGCKFLYIVINDLLI